METVALICVALTLARKKIGNSVIFSFIFNQEHFAPQKTQRRSARSASAVTNPDALSSGYQRLSGPISPFQHSKDVLGLRLTPSERVRRTGDRRRDSRRSEAQLQHQPGPGSRMWTDLSIPTKDIFLSRQTNAQVRLIDFLLNDTRVIDGFKNKPSIKVEKPLVETAEEQRWALRINVFSLRQ